MKRKPWPILALALFQWFSPLGDWLMSSWASHLTPVQYLRLVFAEQGISGYFFHSWVPAIVAGFAVYRVKPWSYPVFLSCILYSSYRSGSAALRVFGHSFVTNPHVWSAHAGSLAIWAIPLGVNLCLGAWFLLPETRRPFLNRALRWWEAAPRFAVSLPARIFLNVNRNSGDEPTGAQILNLSRGGALLEVRSDSALQVGDLLLFGFQADPLQSLVQSVARGNIVTLQERPYPVPWIFSEARVVHRGDRSREKGSALLGVEFCGMSPRSRKSLAKFLQACRSLGVFQLREETGFLADLRHGWQCGLQHFSGGVSKSAAQPFNEEDKRRAA